MEDLRQQGPAGRTRRDGASATIGDVAMAAGVSPMTVSRYINGSNVRAASQIQIERAIRDLNYRPNQLAQSLATGRSMLIACGLMDLADPYHSQVIKGMEFASKERGYTVIVYDTGSSVGADACIDMALSRQLDGVILHRLHVTHAQVQRLSRAGVRCVLIDNEEKITGVTCVDTDNYEGGQQVAQYLLERGHTAIGYVQSGAPDAEGVTSTKLRPRVPRERMTGFAGTLREHGVEPVFFGRMAGSAHDGFSIGKEAVVQLLRRSHRPTAIYCESDILALGALSELLERQIPVPEEMAVVGHDGIEMCTMLFPRVTTMMQPRYEIGRLAADRLIDLLEGADSEASIVTRSFLFRGDTA